MRLCEKHSDCIFMSFTNGTLIDEEFAQEMLRVKNFFPVLSVEGDMDATDFRRGMESIPKSFRPWIFSTRTIFRLESAAVTLQRTYHRLFQMNSSMK